MLRKIIPDDGEPKILPVVIAERCVHTQLTQASCRACVDACPVDAWVIDVETLGINTESCDGCGLCAPACPQGAIASQRVGSALEWKGRNTALLACELAGAEGKQGIIPCLHALGLQELLQMYRGGTRHLSVASGDCTSCIRGRASRLCDLVEQLNCLLGSRNLATINLQVIPSGQWKYQSEETKPWLNEPAISRRSFFRRAAESSIVFGMDIAGLQEEKTFVPPGKLLPRARLDDIVPFAPRIEPAKCNGCDACVRLCPQDAISLCTDNDNPQYRLDAESCTGCAICLDVCDQNAVSISYWRPQAQFLLPLTARRCRACGAPFHLPAVKVSSSDLCPVCLNTNHASNLYQVMGETQ